MVTDRDGTGRLPAAFMTPGSSSFTDFLGSYAPDLLPGRRTPPTTAMSDEAPHGTTIIAAAYTGGVVMAADRRATQGNLIAVRDVDKISPADEYSVVGMAGSAGIGAELVRLFQVELEHYEKREGTPLSLDGKANRLSTLLRGNLGMAMQGLAAVPIFAGYEEGDDVGRIFSYDVTGGRYEEHTFHSIGSGSWFARGAMKKLYREGLDRDSVVAACLQALYDAAEDDSATGGPDVSRQIYPRVAIVNDEGYRPLTDEEVAELVDRMLTGRAQYPDGPKAPVFEPESTGPESNSTGEGDAQ